MGGILADVPFCCRHHHRRRRRRRRCRFRRGRIRGDGHGDGNANGVCRLSPLPTFASMKHDGTLTTAPPSFPLRPSWFANRACPLAAVVVLASLVVYVASAPSLSVLAATTAAIRRGGDDGNVGLFGVRRSRTHLPSFRGGGASDIKEGGGVKKGRSGGPMGRFVRTIWGARRHLCAAAAARCVSIFAMYPMDTIKTRMQMEQDRALRLEGLYRGVGGSLVGQVPYRVLTFGSYEMYKEALLKNLPTTPPTFVYALSAILGDVTGSGWLCPSEVVKQQMQAGMYSSTKEAIKGIWSKKGISGFYQGYAGGLARDVPFRVAQLTSYEVTKKLYLRVKARRRKYLEVAPVDVKAVTSKRKQQQQEEENKPKVELSPLDAAMVGAISGTFSAAITAPLDRIKTLLMTDSASYYGPSVRSCASRIWTDEGLGGFFAGVVPRVTYIAPSVAIFFIAYEAVQQRMAPAAMAK